MPVSWLTRVVPSSVPLHPDDGAQIMASVRWRRRLARRSKGVVMIYAPAAIAAIVAVVGLLRCWQIDDDRRIAAADDAETEDTLAWIAQIWEAS